MVMPLPYGAMHDYKLNGALHHVAVSVNKQAANVELFGFALLISRFAFRKVVF